MRIQPHKTAFIEVSNPKAILEHDLRNYTCLTKGDTININFFNKNYKIDVLEIKPENKNNCICVIDTSVNLDFAPPKVTIIYYKKIFFRIMLKKKKLTLKKLKRQVMFLYLFKVTPKELIKRKSVQK